MASRAFAFVVWAVVAASAVFWLLRLVARPPVAPPQTVTVGEASLRGDVTRVLGREAEAAEPDAPAPVATSLKLLGVVAPRQGSDVRSGVALISIEGQPPKPYQVGAVVDADLVLLSVRQRAAALGPRQGPATLTLELPALPPPATGTLPAAGSEAAAPTPGRTGGAGPRGRLPSPVAAPVPGAVILPNEPPVPVEEEPQPPPQGQSLQQ